jgi:hypothetical protein
MKRTDYLSMDNKVYINTGEQTDDPTNPLNSQKLAANFSVKLLSWSTTFLQV